MVLIYRVPQYLLQRAPHAGMEAVVEAYRPAGSKAVVGIEHDVVHRDILLAFEVPDAVLARRVFGDRGDMIGADDPMEDADEE
jgi:hypothetical protein